jgi:hypothetical protein
MLVSVAIEDSVARYAVNSSFSCWWWGTETASSFDLGPLLHRLSRAVVPRRGGRGVE